MSSEEVAERLRPCRSAAEIALAMRELREAGVRSSLLWPLVARYAGGLPRSVVRKCCLAAERGVEGVLENPLATEEARGQALRLLFRKVRSGEGGWAAYHFPDDWRRVGDQLACFAWRGGWRAGEEELEHLLRVAASTHPSVSLRREAALRPLLALADVPEERLLSLALCYRERGSGDFLLRLLTARSAGPRFWRGLLEAMHHRPMGALDARALSVMATHPPLREAREVWEEMAEMAAERIPRVLPSLVRHCTPAHFRSLFLAVVGRESEVALRLLQSSSRTCRSALLPQDLLPLFQSGDGRMRERARAWSARLARPLTERRGR